MYLKSEINKVKELLDKIRDYKKVSNITGLTVCALTCHNHKKWHIKIRPWNKQNTQYLIDNFPNYTDQWLAQKLGLVQEQIQRKARQLKLKKSKIHINKIQLKNSINIVSGPNRHSGPSANIVYKCGPNHHRWIHDRSKIKGRRNKQVRFSPRTRQRAAISQDYKCKFCKMSLVKMEFDHIQPVVIGGTSDLSNCQVLCPKCHNSKTKLEQLISNNFKSLRFLRIIYETYQFIAKNHV